MPRRILIFVTSALFCLGADQWAKWAVLQWHEELGGRYFLWATSLFGVPFRIVLTYNEGLVLGIFRGNPWIVYAVIAFASAVLASYAITELRQGGHPWNLGFLGMIFGGALGNTADRVIRGRVVDFISIGKFPIFNSADIFIVTGILGLWLVGLVEGRLGAAQKGLKDAQQDRQPAVQRVGDEGRHDAQEHDKETGNREA